MRDPLAHDPETCDKPVCVERRAHRAGGGAASFKVSAWASMMVALMKADRGLAEDEAWVARWLASAYMRGVGEGRRDMDEVGR